MNHSLSGITGRNSGLTPTSHLNTGKVKNQNEVKTPQSENLEVKDGVVLSNPKEQPPEEPPKMVKVSTFPQDPYLDTKPAVEEIEQSKVGTNLSGPRVRSNDSKPFAIADPDGNFFYEPLQREFDQVNAHISAYKTLDMHKDFLGRDISWAFGKNQLEVNSHKDKGANAYYHRWAGSINFFYFESEGLGKTVQTAQSSDVVAHETGHATLDGMKPKYLGSWGGETMAFHEAFSDATAMLYTVSREDNIDKLIEETGGNLNSTNRMTMLAEEFGKAVRLMNTDPSDDDMTYLRNANNTFKYVPQSELPEQGGREELTSGAHSFSRIFSGAFYDCYKNLTAKFAEELPGIPPAENEIPPEGEAPPPTPDYKGAMKSARDVIGNIFLKGVEMGPSSSASFKTMALSMLNADKMINEGKYSGLLADVFISRDILKPEDIPQNEASIREGETIKLDKPVTTEKQALAFLKANGEKLGIDPSEYGEARVMTNNRGETTIEFDSMVEVPLNHHGLYKVANVEDTWVDIHGGLTLGFDKNGSLVSKLEDKITPEKIRTTMDEIRKSQEKGMVRVSPPIYKNDNIFKSKNKPYHAEVYQEPSGKMKVRRIPIIVK